MTESFKNISITLKEDMIEALDRYTREHETNRSLVVRTCLRELLVKEGYMTRK